LGLPATAKPRHGAGDERAQSEIALLAHWLDGPVNEAITLQRPLPNELLLIVATGEKSNQVLVEG
jgi:hypothetical protein